MYPEQQLHSKGALTALVSASVLLGAAGVSLTWFAAAASAW